MGDEYRLHVAIVKHVNSAFIGAHNPNMKFFHVPNQNKDATQAFFNQQLGVLPGVPDLIFSWPANIGGLEIKAPTGKLSSPQNRFLSWAKLIGWHTGTAKSVRQAHHLLVMWGLKAAHQSIVEPDYSTQQQKFERAFDWYKPQ